MSGKAVATKATKATKVKTKATKATKTTKATKVKTKATKEATTTYYSGGTGVVSSYYDGRRQETYTDGIDWATLEGDFDAGDGDGNEW